MEIDQYVECIARESDQLLESAGAAGLDTVVPSCPDWTVRDLVTHMGGVHRWAADLIANSRQEFGTEVGAAVGTGPGDDVLIDWARDGRDELLAALRAAPVDLACFTMWPADNALHFWARRQTHETGIHRADADAAAGRPSAYDEPVATDGINEFLTGFARRKKTYPQTAIRLAAESGSWQITMGDDGIAAAPVEGSTPDPDVTVSGSAGDLYLWLWNRPAVVRCEGDSAAAARWEQIRVRWS